MKTTYLIWKNPQCKGVCPDWMPLTGAEFLALVRSPKGKGRNFIKLASTDNDGADGTIVIEVTASQYREWKNEKNRADYVKKLNNATAVTSYHSMKSDDGECFGEEILASPDSDAEAESINALTLEKALTSLSDEEIHLVNFLYMTGSGQTLRAYQELTGIPKSTVDRRHKAILKKIKNFFRE
jgi:hypothetical protein